MLAGVIPRFVQRDPLGDGISKGLTARYRDSERRTAVVGLENR